MAGGGAPDQAWAPFGRNERPPNLMAGARGPKRPRNGTVLGSRRHRAPESRPRPALAVSGSRSQQVHPGGCQRSPGDGQPAAPDLTENRAKRPVPQGARLGAAARTPTAAPGPLPPPPRNSPCFRGKPLAACTHRLSGPLLLPARRRPRLRPRGDATGRADGLAEAASLVGAWLWKKCV